MANNVVRIILLIIIRPNPDQCRPNKLFFYVWDVIENTKLRILEDEHRFRKELEKEQKKFEKDLEQYSEFAENFTQRGPCDDTELTKVILIFFVFFISFLLAW